MKKKFILCLFIIIPLFYIITYSQTEISDIIEKTGGLSEIVNEAAEGNVDFSFILNFLKETFFSEFIKIKEIFAVLMCISLIASLIECLTLKESVTASVRMCINAACILTSSEIMIVFFDIAKNTVGETGDFIFLSVPYLCSLLASSGKTLTAAKGTLISLGSANILTYFIENIFMPVSYLFYVLAVASSVIENDIFKSIKKTVISCEKVLLPFIVGLYTTVLTLFVKTSSGNDEFVLKAAKSVLSASVPFLGNVLKSSADTVLNSVNIIKSQAGIISVIALIAVLATPLIKLFIGIFVFKILGIISLFTGSEKLSSFFEELSVVVSFLAGMTGTVGVITVISIICLI